MRSGTVRVAVSESDRAAALTVRHRVFVDEQGVPAELEHDGNDDEATHFVAYTDGDPIGAARLRAVASDTAKVERVAVLADKRGEDWGRRIMNCVEETAIDRGLTRLVLHAQTDVEGFYDELGYRTVSDEFEEAGIPHVEMEKRLD